MITISISSEELKDTLERLWEKCETESCSFRMIPRKKLIEVYKIENSLSSHLLAEINVIDITDSYEVTKVIFNQ
jgi:ribosomal protein S26